MVITAKSLARIALRLTAEQDALIRQAAEVEGTDLTNFTVTATLAHARDVLADGRLFALDDAADTNLWCGCRQAPGQQYPHTRGRQ
jgi:uncharacterized protein (DUF1778 family)